MSDALPLPPHPNIEQYKKLAKDFQQACKSGAPGAIRDWAARWAEKLAELRGLEITPLLRSRIDFESERLAGQWREFKETKDRASRCVLADAQYFVARAHGFASWPRFTRHLDGLQVANSPISTFESAVDAIVSGDLMALEKLLNENPGLAKARSTREHRSTLLHYVSANGVEDFRQRTPRNIVEITRLLLERGADVNAESEAYGGRSTTLGLTATSWHPEKAGVQIPLMELLFDHGAVIDGPDGGSAVIGCLQNGRGKAAEFFASHGALLDLEGAAGAGRLDVVRSFVNDDGSLKPTATQQQLKDGFAWACEFGRTSVVDFLLSKSIDVTTKLKPSGQTGLHWAAFFGHIDTVKSLLSFGAPVDVKDESFGKTPLGWALFGWGQNQDGADHYEVVTLLSRAGAKLDQEWYEDNEVHRRAVEEKMRSDPRMIAALRGESPH